MKMRHVNVNFFTPDDRRALASILPDELKVNGMGDQFIDATELAAERVNANPRAKPSEVKERFVEIAKAAKDLQKALQAFGGGSDHYKRLAAIAQHEGAGLSGPRELLPRMHDDLETLATWCSGVAEPIKPARSEKPSTDWAYWLALETARAHVRLFARPPHKHKSRWFAAYMEAAGTLAGVNVGHVVVTRAVEELTIPPV